MNIPTLTALAKHEGAHYAWLRQSLNDYEMATILQNAKKWDGACYHAQQATEKALKFLLSYAGVTFRHTHSVHELAKDCNSALTQTVFNDEYIDRFKELTPIHDDCPLPSFIKCTGRHHHVETSSGRHANLDRNIIAFGKCL